MCVCVCESVYEPTKYKKKKNHNKSYLLKNVDLVKTGPRDPNQNRNTH